MVFLAAFDVATIPFVISKIMLPTLSVKLFKYMAGRKPILSFKMLECMRHESVRTYENAGEFFGSIRRAYYNEAGRSLVEAFGPRST